MEIDNLEAAKRNRERLKKPCPEVDHYYRSQQRIINHWLEGKPAPPGLALGNLPQVSPARIHIEQEDN